LKFKLKSHGDVVGKAELAGKNLKRHNIKGLCSVLGCLKCRVISWCRVLQFQKQPATILNEINRFMSLELNTRQNHRGSKGVERGTMPKAVSGVTAAAWRNLIAGGLPLACNGKANTAQRQRAKLSGRTATPAR
jgi:hypothetical protein